MGWVNNFSFRAKLLSAGAVPMSYFDEYRRGVTSVRLMVDYFQDQGASASRLLAGTGLARSDLDDPNTDILARQELRVVANILAQVPDAQTHAAALAKAGAGGSGTTSQYE